jgi:hypothetical protein
VEVKTRYRDEGVVVPRLEACEAAGKARAVPMLRVNKTIAAAAAAAAKTTTNRLILGGFVFDLVSLSLFLSLALSRLGEAD